MEAHVRAIAAVDADRLCQAVVAELLALRVYSYSLL